jgi:hypothetical protein
MAFISVMAKSLSSDKFYYDNRRIRLKRRSLTQLLFDVKSQVNKNISDYSNLTFEIKRVF